ncbi:DUF3570 domain-containing protein [Shewanella colwelliana]|uniref:DUF3570 domain-containing protein n=1 Tax=Shewanella colwelliana TaxID=23 RepID=UPI0022AF5308|nr:DUF3570 domain-containing protein [Shewanella colwelliana]MCZ4338083.1 DUF3570 domain-containing protein [Shewanella colwelliana]
MAATSHKEGKEDSGKVTSVSQLLIVAAASLLSQSSLANPGREASPVVGTGATALITDASTHVETHQVSPKVDVAMVYYQERDRVTVAEGIFKLNQNFGDKDKLVTKLALDTITGASANGAVTQQQIQTFTRPSGTGVYQARPGETPLDDTFKDTRLQLSSTWIHIPTAGILTTLGGYLSREYDYTSIGLNGGGQWSFNKGNTQANLAGGYFYDVANPVGGRPVPMSEMVFRRDFDSDAAFRAEFDKTRQSGSESKQTVDVVLGLTQTINKYWLMQLNYGVSYVSGYLSDPYKVLSRINNDGHALGYHYEHRPDKRLKQSLYVMGKRALTYGVFDLSYRYSIDDWSIDSHTLESRYRVNLTTTSFVQLHLRAYQQTAAEFYRLYLREDQALPQYGSADYRLGAIDSYTIGLKYGQRLKDGTLATFRLEYYQQRPQNSGFDLVGQLARFDQFPNNDAIIAQVGFSF